VVPKKGKDYKSHLSAFGITNSEERKFFRLGINDYEVLRIINPVYPASNFQIPKSGSEERKGL
jgi:hypothetical protein